MHSLGGSKSSRTDVPQHTDWSTDAKPTI